VTCWAPVDAAQAVKTAISPHERNVLVDFIGFAWLVSAVLNAYFGVAAVSVPIGL
jgi:hypothetical protein